MLENYVNISFGFDRLPCLAAVRIVPPYWRYAMSQRLPLAISLGSLLFLTALNAHAQAEAKTVRLAVVSQELLSGEVQASVWFNSILRSPLSGLGLTYGGEKELRKAGLGITELLAGGHGAALAKSQVDIVLAAQLKGRLLPQLQGNPIYEGELQLKLIDGNSGAVIFEHRSKSQGSAPGLTKARGMVVRQIFRPIWRTIREHAENIKQSKGDLYVVVRGTGDAMSGQRLSGLLRTKPDFTQVKLLPREAGADLQLRLSPKPGRSAADLLKVLDHGVGLKVNRQRLCTVWTTVDLKRLGLVRVKISGDKSTPDLLGAGPLLATLLSTALENSATVTPSPLSATEGEALAIGWDDGKLRAELADGTTLKTNLRHPHQLLSAIWTLAGQIDAKFAGQHKVHPTPWFAPKKGLSDFDLLGALTSRGEIIGANGPASLGLPKEAQVRVEVPEYSTKALVASGKVIPLNVPLELAKLQALTEAKATRLRINLNWGTEKDPQADVLVIPLVVWPLWLVDQNNSESWGHLVDPTAPGIQALMDQGTKELMGLSAFHKIDQSLWIPLATYSIFQSLELKATPAVSEGRFRRLPLPWQTLASGEGDSWARAMLYTTMLTAGGARTHLFSVKGKPVVGVDTGHKRGAIGFVALEKNRLVELDGTLWLCLSLDGTTSFSQAWTKGSALAKKKATDILVVPAKVSSGPSDQEIKITNPSQIKTTCSESVATLTNDWRSAADKVIRKSRIGKAGLGKRLTVAVKLLQVGAIQQAEALLEPALLLKKAPPGRLHLILGIAHAYRGTYGLAAESFDKAGNTASARINLAIMRTLQLKNAEARRLLYAEAKGGRSVARSLGLVENASPMPWQQGPDPAAPTLRRLAGQADLSERERVVGSLRGPDRRLIRLALALLRDR